MKRNQIICEVKSSIYNKLQTNEKRNTLHSELNFNNTRPTESNETDAIDNADTPDAPFNLVVNNSAATTKHSSGYNMNTSPRTSRTTRSVNQGGANKTHPSTVSPRPGATSTTKSPTTEKTVNITVTSVLCIYKETCIYIFLCTEKHLKIFCNYRATHIHIVSYLEGNHSYAGLTETKKKMICKGSH